MRRPTSILADGSGGAAVEFALALPVLLLTLAGVGDGARLIAQSMRVNAAAQAGAEFAQKYGWDEAGVRAASASATPSGAAPTITARQALGCVVQGALAETTAAKCADGHPSGRYAVVGAQAPFKPLTPLAGLALPQAVSATARVRIP